MPRHLPIVILFAAATNAFADSSALKEKEEALRSECNDTGSFRVIFMCYSDLGKEADTELNAQYKRLMDVLNAESKSRLVEAQRLWISFRDADCLVHEPMVENELLSAVNRSMCIYKRTVQRLEQLEDHYALLVQ